MVARRRLKSRAALLVGLSVAVGAGGLWWFVAGPGAARREAPRSAPAPPSAPSASRARTAPAAPEAPGAVRDWPGYRTQALTAAAAAVHDGDTFTADLDGNGRLDPPRERVRLLFVDTPELGESWKGQDTPHGLPARAFLAAQLQRSPRLLRIPADRPTDRYGRTLALVLAGGTDVSLALIQAGHSYFDTRFGFPPGAATYAAYAAAEGEAFDARRGIWGDAPSRQRYLERLARERKTPAGRSNSRFEPRVLQATGLRPAAHLGRYVRVRGRVAGLRRLRKGVRLLQLAAGAGEEPLTAEPLTAVAFALTAARLSLDDWEPGADVQIEGFIQTHKGRVELLLHYGQRLP